jgi:hypothetical protein
MKRTANSGCARKQKQREEAADAQQRVSAGSAQALSLPTVTALSGTTANVRNADESRSSQCFLLVP